MPLDAIDLAAAFGLGRPLGPSQPLANGDHPTSTRVLTTDRGRWVVKTNRLLGDWQRDQALRSHRLESAALAAGIGMPHPVEPPDPAVGYWHQSADDQLVRVTRWVPGGDLRQSGVGSHASRAAEAAGWMGETLGRIAALDLAADAEQASALHPVADWHSWVEEAEAGAQEVAKPARALLPIVEEATALIRHALRDGPRTVLMHGDVSQANVVRTPTGYALIDWDTAGAAVPWWEAVNVAFRFATPFNGPTADADVRVVRPLIESYLDQGAPAGLADSSAFAGLLRSQLASVAWCLWLALGHRQADATQRAFGLGIVTAAAEGLPTVLGSVDRWAGLLR